MARALPLLLALGLVGCGGSGPRRREGDRCAEEGSPQTESCYEGPPGTELHAPCARGTRFCIDGFWSPCTGQTLPAVEVCDEIDNDCDGLKNEAVDGSRGIGGVDTPFDCAADQDRRLVCADGTLSVESITSRAGEYIWIPTRGVWENEEPAMLSKVSTSSFEVEGRYRISEGRPSYIGGISVNLDGRVAATASYPRPAISAYDAYECRAGATSTGPDDVKDFGEDACLAWTLDFNVDWAFGVTNLAWELRDGLDRPEHFLWVVENGGRKVMELTDEGETTDREVVVAPASPGAVAFDADMDLWVSDSGSAAATMTEVDTVAAEVIRTIPMPGWTCLCMSVDADNYVWATGSGGPGYILDQDEEEAYAVDIPYGVGIAVGANDYGWFGGSNGKVYRADASAGLDDIWVDEFDAVPVTEAGVGAIYVAVDGTEQVWGLAQADAGAAYVWPPENPDDYLTAVKDLSNPGACGDMTGSQLAHLVDPADVFATYVWRVDGCAFGTTWSDLGFDLETPEGTSVEFSIRSAATEWDLANATRVPVCSAPASTSPCSIEDALAAVGLETGTGAQIRGPAFEVEIRLVPSRTAVPVVRGVWLQ